MEYTLILPLVIAVVFILIFTGYIQHQKAVLKSATARGAILGCKIIVDPNYKLITTTDSNKDDNDIKNISIRGNYKESQPYRYLFRKSGDLPDVETGVRNFILVNQIFLNNEPTVEAKEEAGILRKITISAKQDYTLPLVLPALKLPNIVTIESESTAYVNEPAEFIRNADFAIELIKPVINNVMTKLKTTITKIKIFSNLK